MNLDEMHDEGVSGYRAEAEECEGKRCPARRTFLQLRLTTGCYHIQQRRSKTRMFPIQYAIVMLQNIQTLPPVVSLLSPLLCCCFADCLEDVFYDALDNYAPEEGPGEVGQPEQQQDQHTDGSGSAAGSVQDRLRLLDMPEQQRLAVRALLEEQTLLQMRRGEPGDTDSEEEHDGSESEGDSGIGEDAGVMDEGVAVGEDEGMHVEVEGVEWGMGGQRSRLGPEQYAHPDQIPRFTSKTEWYQAHSNRPLYTGAQLTTLQAVYMLMAWKANYAVTDKAFDALLGMMNQLFLPKVSADFCWL
jgi:hypothetical protein